MKMSWSILFLAGLAWCLSGGGPGFGQFPTGGVSFKNDTPIPVIVQGASKVNNMIRNGQPVVIPPGRSAWDTNLPPGIRFITIYDASQPNRILLQQRPVLFQNRDLFFSIFPIGPGRVELKDRPPGP